MEIVRFGPEHLEGAAEALAAAHRVNRKRDVRLPQRYEEAGEARWALESAAKGGGVAAVRDGTVVGYLVALLAMDALERVAVVLPAGAAIEPGEDAELYRQMYAAAAEQWVRDGYFTHYVHVASCDGDVVEAWHSLGFGRYSVFNYRDLSPVPGPEAEVVIRRVESSAFEEYARLRDGLKRYNATSPILHPLVDPMGRALEAALDDERRRMDDTANAYFIAYWGGAPAGLMIFEPPQPHYVLTPDGSVYLHIAFVDDGARAGGVGAAMVNRGFEWAREQGYEGCTVGYFSPNLLGARFWPGKGFRPIGYCLERRLDPRIAWARG